MKCKIESGKLYLITGASGFLGTVLCKRVLELGGLVRALSRNEGKLIELKQKFPTIEIYIGDISDKFVVRQAMNGVNGVFHLAASKHVGLAEKFVRESVLSNTIGSLNIYEQSLDQNLDFVLSISTDKAAQVNGVYGATKFLMERLAKQYESLNPDCQYRIVRYGNVLYSTGSVLCKWKSLIQEGKDVIVTDPNATRFFWTIDQAIDLIFDCMNNASNSNPYCPKMKSISIKNLLQAMIEKYSNDRKISIKQIGLQPGENLHEKIMEEGPYSNDCDEYSVDEIKELV